MAKASPENPFIPFYAVCQGKQQFGGLVTGVMISPLFDTKAEAQRWILAKGLRATEVTIEEC